MESGRLLVISSTSDFNRSVAICVTRDAQTQGSDGRRYRRSVKIGIIRRGEDKQGGRDTRPVLHRRRVGGHPKARTQGRYRGGNIADQTVGGQARLDLGFHKGSAQTPLRYGLACGAEGGSQALPASRRMRSYGPAAETPPVYVAIVAVRTAHSPRSTDNET